MAAPPRLKTALEIREIAGSTSSRVLPDEVAETIPVVTKAGGRVEAIVLYYDDKDVRGQRIISPPHHAMRLDAETGKVLRFWACTPDDLGVKNPPKTVPGTGLDPKLKADEFWHKRDRLTVISAPVWEAFAAGVAQPDATTKDLIKEYKTLFEQTTFNPLAPYFEAVAADFFAWLRKVAP